MQRTLQKQNLKFARIKLFCIANTNKLLKANTINKIVIRKDVREADKYHLRKLKLTIKMNNASTSCPLSSCAVNKDGSISPKLDRTYWPITKRASIYTVIHLFVG